MASTIAVVRPQGTAVSMVSTMKPASHSALRRYTPAKRLAAHFFPSTVPVPTPPWRRHRPRAWRSAARTWAALPVRPTKSSTLPSLQPRQAR